MSCIKLGSVSKKLQVVSTQFTNTCAGIKIFSHPLRRFLWLLPYWEVSFKKKNSKSDLTGTTSLAKKKNRYHHKMLFKSGTTPSNGETQVLSHPNIPFRPSLLLYLIAKEIASFSWRAPSSSSPSLSTMSSLTATFNARICSTRRHPVFVRHCPLQRCLKRCVTVLPTTTRRPSRIVCMAVSHLCPSTK